MGESYFLCVISKIAVVGNIVYVILVLSVLSLSENYHNSQFAVTAFSTVTKTYSTLLDINTNFKLGFFFFCLLLTLLTLNPKHITL